MEAERPGREYSRGGIFPPKGGERMSEIGAIVLLIVATGYILAINQKK